MLSFRMTTVLAGLAVLAEGAFAQNLTNTGKIVNTGTIRVKQQAVGIDSLNGTFELFGTNQTVPAAQFGNLSLTGTGNYNAAGNATVNKNFTIAPAVTLQVPSTSIITLGSSSGQMTENGYLSGKVRKTVNLAAPSPDTAFGGIGVSVSWQGTNPGVTTATRTSGTTVTVNGKQSIQRYYDIVPTNTSSVNGQIRFTYSNSELGGSSASALELWRSPDNGATWRREKTVRNGNTLVKTDLQSFGRWTAADTNNLLGLAAYEWTPDSLKLFAGNNQTARVRRLLDTAFVATVVDAYGQPTEGQNVVFTVSSKPLNATGDSLTVLSATSDSTGQVKTFLKLGSTKGDYYVQASVPGVTSAVTTFHAFARPAASIFNALPLIAALDTVRSQIDSIRVQALDSIGTAVQGVQVNFAVTQAPDTAGAYQLTSTTVSTDTSGLAFTNFKLGSKSGDYVVSASSPDVDPPVTRQFSINAKPGSVGSVNYAGGGVDSVTALKTFLVQILDSYKNPRKGDTVQFALLSKPTGSTLDSLFAATAVTDSNGYATTTLRVGQKSGDYRVYGVVKSRPQFADTFVTRAHSLAVSNMLVSAPILSDTIGAVLPALSVSLADKYNNPVSRASVAFAVTQRPDSLAGGSLSAASVQTDSILGQASTFFTAGDKVGIYVVHASSGGVSQNFSVQVLPGKPSQMLAAGTYQSKPIMQATDSSFEVKLTDRKGNPLANLPVHFSVIQKPLGAVGEKLAASNVTTNSQGIASTGFVVGSKEGSYVILAYSDSLGGVAKTFTVNATNGTAFALVSSRGQYQRKSILSLLDTAFVVSLTDKGGNPVPGAVVNFAITGRPDGTTQDSLSSTSDTTDVNGLASTFLRLGTKVGTYTVTATAPVLPTVSRQFAATAMSGAAFAATKISGDQQLTLPYRQLDSIFVVNVRDVGNNPIPGAPVRFNIVQVPIPGTIGQSLSDTNAVTDSLGRASTRLTVGSEVGRYVVSANVNGLAPVTFSTTAYLMTGDANLDASINIGDLTTVIDHILGKLPLSPSDSAVADINTDGEIDIRDVILLRDRLLTGNWSRPVEDTLFALKPNIAAKQSVAASQTSLRVLDTTSLASVSLASDIEVTQNGMRLNLSNNTPVRALQYVIHMKNPPKVQKPDVIYERAKMMTVIVFRTDTTLRVVAYNLNNTPILPGDGAVFRLPIQASFAPQIDTALSPWVVSEGTNNRAIAIATIGLQKATIDKYPTDYRLDQNYPNPFNGSTIIKYQVPDVVGKLARVTLQVFDLLGRKVKTLVKEDKEPGWYSASWDATNDAGQRVASGVYFYRLVWKDNQTVKKLILLK